MVYRAYVEKKSGLDNEARSLKNELVSLLGIESLEKVRVLNRYDIENIEKDLFDYLRIMTEKILGEFSCGRDRLFKLRYMQYEWMRVVMEQARREKGLCSGIIWLVQKIPSIRSLLISMV